MKYSYGRGHAHGGEPIDYPFQPANIKFQYVSADNWFMQLARRVAEVASFDEKMPNGSVLVRNGRVIGWGANGSEWHLYNVCERDRLQMPSGQGYDLCPGCHPRNHGEPKAIESAKMQGEDMDDATLYMWGHYWCCEPCCEAMDAAGIRTVVMLDGSEVLFDRNAQGNIVGRQFEATRPAEPQYGTA